MKEVIKKLRFKSAGTVLHVPADLQEAFVVEGFNCVNLLPKNAAGIIAFVEDKTALDDFLQNELEKVTPDSLLWIAYPKGSSKIKTNINRDSVRETAEKYQIATVTAVSINDIWSALRFRPLEKVGS